MGKSVTEAKINDLIERSTIDNIFWEPKTTVVRCVLPNGWIFVESSSCVDPDNYDHQMGVDICTKRIKDKLWELEGYLLQNEI